MLTETQLSFEIFTYCNLAVLKPKCVTQNAYIHEDNKLHSYLRKWLAKLHLLDEVACKMHAAGEMWMEMHMQTFKRNKKTLYLLHKWVTLN